MTRLLISKPSSGIQRWSWRCSFGSTQLPQRKTSIQSVVERSRNHPDVAKNLTGNFSQRLLTIIPFPENAAANAHHRAALFDGKRIIAAHAEA